MNALIGIVMGSDSDLPTMKADAQVGAVCKGLFDFNRMESKAPCSFSPPDAIEKTTEKYLEAHRRLTQD